MKENDVVHAFKEFSAWGMSHRLNIYVVRTDAEYVFVHVAFSKHCDDHGMTISPSTPHLKEMSGQSYIILEVLWECVIDRK